MSRLDLVRAYAPRIADAVSPEQALTMYVPGYRPRNKFALCIAHQEDTPSMRIGPKYVHCFGCGFFGDSIEIVKRLFDIGALAALTKLNNDFGIGLPLGRRPTLRESMEIKARADKIAKERRDLKEERLARFERRIDLEKQLILLEDILNESRPTDRDAPFGSLFTYYTPKIEYLKYLIDCEA